MFINDPIFYLVAIPAVLLVGISKSGLAGGVGGIGVPLMSLAIAPFQAAAIMLPLLCLMDVFGFGVYYKKWDVQIIKIIIPGALLGIVLGTLTFGMLPESVIRILLGAIAVVFTLNNWLRLAEKQKPAGRSVSKGLFWSAMSGYTSFVAHAGAPPLMVYLLPQRPDKVTYIATVTLFFSVVNLIKLVPYTWLGQFSLVNLETSLLLAPLVPAGIWIGVWMQRRLSTLWFYRITQIGMFLTGLQLIYQGVADMLVAP